jgi:hypothetical protein
MIEIGKCFSRKRSGGLVLIEEFMAKENIQGYFDEAFPSIYQTIPCVTNFEFSHKDVIEIKIRSFLNH